MEALDNTIVEEQATKEIEKAINTDQNAVPYTPLSKLPALGTVVPLNLAGETLQAQFDFIDEIPDIDQYLVEKLGYTSKLKLSEHLAAEQADAVAMAIRQIEKDKAFILADMTGTGKGRVCASIIRYAFVNGYLPIFITEKDNLFSALYRDLVDIGGIETKPAGKPNFGFPLILNGFKSGGKEKTYTEDGKRIITEKPSQTSIVRDGKEVIKAPLQEEIKEIIKGDKLPKAYDYLMLTYNQISGEKSGKKKVEYILRLIEKNKGKVILVADESHNAAGTSSSTGEAMTQIVSAVKGCLFSSATFSKRPDNMYIYSIKTDVSLSPLGTDKLIQVIKAGGERLIENLASNLVAGQQMLRREKTYDNCNVLYNYMQEEGKNELFKKYDATIKEYVKLQQFFASSLFFEASRNALKRFAKENKVELAPPAPKGVKEFNEWVMDNAGKYYRSSFTAGEIKRNQFQFIETLLFALKADFVANQALEQLLTQTKNIKVQGKEEFISNRKPVIAVRNTLEGIYYSLGLEVGDTLDKADFSKYVESLARESMTGAVTLKEILIDDVKGGKKREKDEKKKRKQVSGELEVELSDFSDKGVRYNEILEEIKNINLDIPLSPIDYIINKIQSTKRASWDTNGIGEYFRVGEVTGRKFSLVPVLDGGKTEYKLEVNKKAKNRSVTFQEFNNGSFDVLLINESGSTGEDAHSAEKFKDKRPRVMVIHQVELDVSTEVQKRGRINRTGMVNYPTYVYAVSRIPSEIRRLLMLVRKMRSLDANTTGNQKQSAKLSTIKDSFGNEIQDVINKYGDECLDEFVQNNDKVKFADDRIVDYSKYMPTTDQDSLGKLSSSYVIETFVRNLEVAFSDEQEYFYNTINALYIQLKEKYGTEFDLETNIVDLKAAIRTRVVVSKGENTNPFNTSVYEEDDYVLAEEKPYTREKVEELVLSLSGGKDPEENFMEFLEDYENHFKEVHLKEVEESVTKPNYKDAKDKEEKKEMEAEYELRVRAAKERAINEFSAILQVFYENITTDKNGIPKGEKKGGISDTGLNFKPRSAALIPAVIDECYETDEDGEKKVPKELNNAKFCGVKILKTAKDKYSPMNIELIFCQLSGKPKLILKPTARGREVLEWVVVKSKAIPMIALNQITNWEVDPNKRTLMRLFTGNILGAYGVAKDRVMRNSTAYSPILQFIKFTTADNTSIRLGIKVSPRQFVKLTPQNVPVSYQLNSNLLLIDLAKSKQFKRIRNAAENFHMAFNPKGDGGILQVFILGGKATGQSDPKKSKYYCYNKAKDFNLYNDGELRRMFQQPDFYQVTSTFTFKPTSGERYFNAKAIGFQTILPNKIKEVKAIFDYIYSVYPFNIEILGVESEETIANQLDPFVAKAEEGDIEMSEGEFAYDSIKPFVSIKSQLEAYPKFLRYEKTSDFGTIFLNRKASVREAISYGLIPLDNTIVDMVTQAYLSIPNDADKINLNKAINKAIEENKSDFEIGRIVYGVLAKKMNSIKVIFGPEADDISFIGDVFKRYAKGEIELPKKESEQEDKKERPLKKLDLETAQEYVWLLNYKVKTK